MPCDESNQLNEAYFHSAAAYESNVLGQPLSLSQWEHLKTIPVGAIPWSARATYALAGAQCQHLADIVSRTSLDWAKRRNVGARTTRELGDRIRTWLQKNGVGNPPQAPEYYVQLVRYFSAWPAGIPVSLWAVVVKDLKPTGIANYSVGLATLLAKESWPASRYDEPLKVYLTKTPAAFFSISRANQPATRALVATLLKFWLRHKTNGDLGGQNTDLEIGSLEQSIKNNQLLGALKGAIALANLGPAQRRVLELRYGLSGQPPRSQRECAKIIRRTQQMVSLAEQNGLRNLSQHPDIVRAFQAGLHLIQHRLWQQMAGKNPTLIPKHLTQAELRRRAGGAETLLIKVCYGGCAPWLNQTLTITAKGWRIPG